MGDSDMKFPLEPLIVTKNMKEIKEKFDGPQEDASKSQRRREALETRKLASTLIGLSTARLEQLPLDSALRDAIEDARRIRSNVARKRQMQYVAKLMRRIDLEPVIAGLEVFENEARHLAARQHRTEAWRDHLLTSGDTAMGELMEQRRDADGQAIRQLLRNAQREAAAGKPPAAARSLFRLLRELDETAPLPAIANR
jgi:ribosome-associated protein